MGSSVIFTALHPGVLPEIDGPFREVLLEFTDG